MACTSTMQSRKHKTHIRVKLTTVGRDKSLQTAVDQIKQLCQKHRVNVKGPVHLPNIVLRVGARNSPCGEGSGTYTHYLKVYRRKILWLENLSVLTHLPSTIVDTVNFEVTEVD